MHSLRSAVGVTVCMLALAASPARAQGFDRGPYNYVDFANVDLAHGSTDCLSRIPDAEFGRANLSLTVTPAGARWDPAAVPYWTELSRNIGDLIRMSFGSSESTLPPGDARLTWQAAYGRVRVTAYPGRRIRWRVEDTTATSIDSLIAGALSAAVGDGLPDFDASAGDSSIALVSMTGFPTTMPAAALEDARGILIPVFSIRRPAMTPAEQTSRGEQPIYPERLRSLEVEGRVALRFVVDTLGRADGRSISDASSEDAAAFGHLEFIGAARTAVLHQRYQPATVGGCRVPMRVRQLFDFRLDSRAPAGDWTPAPPPLTLPRRGVPPR